MPTKAVFAAHAAPAISIGSAYEFIDPVDRALTRRGALDADDDV